MAGLPIARAEDFTRKVIYHPNAWPGYACWVSFFPGERGQWYIGFEELTKSAVPKPKESKEKFYVMGMPVGYDKSQCNLETVLMESDDGRNTWNEISREPYLIDNALASAFGQAKTKDGDFIRFVWKSYNIGENNHPGEILYLSHDGGATWEKQPPFHDKRFSSYPHRLRTLRDGTLVLALPLAKALTMEKPRNCVNMREMGSMQMNLCFSYDQGRTWTLPLPVYGGQDVSETDFVELPSGDILLINSFIWAHPGRQVVCRTEKGFYPLPFEKSVTPGIVPETVCITEDEILVGCVRSGVNGHQYFLSDDLGLSWEPLEGLPEHPRGTGDVYQPWIQYLGDGVVACAGHYGGDDPIEKEYANYIMMHTFRLNVLRKTRKIKLDVIRDYDEALQRWPNSYTVTLTSGGSLVAGKEIEFWYAERFYPEEYQGEEYREERKLKQWCPPSPDAYNPRGRLTLEGMMKCGGKLLKAETGKDGRANFRLPHLDHIEYIHHDIKFAVMFNRDGQYPDYQSVTTDLYEFYSVMHQ